MPRKLLYLIVFIEGFCSLGAEIIALRRLVPHVGSAIVVTAPTIGLFLLALALGYGSGARVSERFTAVVARNFVIAALLAGIGLARITVDGLFTLVQPTWLAYLLFIGGVLCPLAWLLGQTVPVLTNLMKHMRTGEASGYALYWSTLGSFLGSVSLSLVMMQWLGVSAAVLMCAVLLTLGSLLLAKPDWQAWSKALMVGLAAAFINLQPNAEVVDTAYADYTIKPLPQPGQATRRAFMINNSLASIMDDSQPPNYARYVQHLRHIILDELGLSGREILVLGAGGFTLSHQEPSNHYTYVDIDAEIRAIAEQRFLKGPIEGSFIVDDARRFVRSTDKQFDAVVVDVFSSHTSIPGHLVTREFWQDTRRTLAPRGILLINLILDGRLETPYARNLLATIESVYGRCAVEVLHKSAPLSNVIVSCYDSSHPGRSAPYTDERNNADLDLALSQ
ncbi:fused MFS/spermidine synthase [Rhodoferax sp.]|uniref:fused MFS/spermidine synthase n=1 Tax=Rhodoferax sp. TaxID=50421 RepID=UPI0025E23AF2|nr:fused MFS/spermidine synthase [Rhodoferax sp.]MCM2342154.1 fused MFS/spermidine synthase [Rhodoferax sp.]